MTADGCLALVALFGGRQLLTAPVRIQAGTDNGDGGGIARDGILRQEKWIQPSTSYRQAMTSMVQTQAV